ncbi:HAD family hydrolase [Leptospira ilyithenensis]|uniref:HAD family hydrolase n=2 Tax=Leptospira ilyithenensis TaxID=2484901 RepID=A0A4R9LLX5_9LEPT|nr:HAD family hydrolase [Leptospira ilyithenensis]TGN08572.1 HAD family hydrolase [Leptospira ilyithenensis]
MGLLETKKNWIFDMDGTLTLAMHDFDAIKLALGLPMDSDILTSIGRLAPEEAKTKHIHLNEIELNIAKKATASPGTPKLLKQIKGKSHQLGILTRNCFANSIETLKASGLGEYFSSEFILCREHAEPKPSPNGILNLLNLWDAKPEDTLMIGDYLYDLEAGISAGVETVYIDPKGIFPFKNLATHMVRRLDEILYL